MNGTVVVGAGIAGLTAALIAALIGSSIGILAGFFGGKLDDLLMRSVDVLMAFPYILLALAIVAVLGPGLMNALIAVAIVNIPFFARNVRGVTLVIARSDYIAAARLSGRGSISLLLFEVVPNLWSVIIVAFSTTVGWMILETAGLSFLGLGSQPPQSDLGSMLGEGRAALLRARPRELRRHHGAAAARRVPRRRRRAGLGRAGAVLLRHRPRPGAGRPAPRPEQVDPRRRPRPNRRPAPAGRRSNRGHGRTSPTARGEFPSWARCSGRRRRCRHPLRLRGTGACSAASRTRSSIAARTAPSQPAARPQPSSR